MSGEGQTLESGLQYFYWEELRNYEKSLFLFDLLSGLDLE
jgi:hypothetical protein